MACFSLQCAAIFALIGGAVTSNNITITEHSLNQEKTINMYTDGAKVDLTAGVNITVKCLADGVDDSDMLLRFPTNEYAKFTRFSNTEDVSRLDTGEYKLTNVQYYDTGSVECYNSKTGETISHVYLFIYDADPTTDLFIPLKNKDFTWFVFKNYLPCLPVNSRVQVTVELQNNILSDRFVTVDKTKGVELMKATFPHGIDFRCTYQLGDRTQNQTINLAVKHHIATLPEPMLSSDTGRYHYLRGENITLNCTVNYTETESFLWDYPAKCNSTDDCQSDSRVSEVKNRRSRLSSEVMETFLTVTDLQPSDSGSYDCAYKPSNDQVYRNKVTKSITVYSGPFAKSNEAREVLTGKESDGQLFISVRLQALPKPTVVWSLGDDVIDDGVKYHISIEPTSDNETYYDASMKINSPVRADSAVYVLTAYVDNGQAYSHTFRVDVQVVPEIGVSYTYGNRTKLYHPAAPAEFYQTNHSLELNCKSLQGIPRPDIDWSWQPCDYTNKCQINPNNWTRISDDLKQPSSAANKVYYHSRTPDSRGIRLRAEQSGWLKCEAYNNVGTTPQTIRLAVSDLPKSSQGIGFTQATRQAANQLVDNNSLKLQCHVTRIECTADEVIVVQSNSHVYGRTSEETEEFLITENTFILSVKLQNISLDSDGLSYECQCRGGKLGSPVKLSVKPYVAATWVKSVASDLEIDQGDTQSLICKPQGRPLPTVTWYRNGERVTPGETTLISTTGYNLTILRANSEDTGYYKCVGKTTRASITGSFHLGVREPTMTSKQKQILIISCIVAVTFLVSALVLCCLYKCYSRKKQVPVVSSLDSLLLPSKEMINPDIPLDEQTEALPYDIGWEFPIGNLKIGMLLGQGAFGRVLKAEAMNIENGVASSTVAVKTVRDQQDLRQIKALISELKILIHVGQHLNIVNLLGACTRHISRGKILVIVEYCRYGNLRTYLIKHKNNFRPVLDYVNADAVINAAKLEQICVNLGEEEEYLNPGGTADSLHSADKPVTLRDIISWCYQIARGMEYLASIDYIHRDLAARNVLLAEDNIVKICDFGLAKDVYKYQEYQKQTTGPLPIKWMAVESLTHKIFNVRTDVWSYGVTVWELFSLAASPYPGLEIDEHFINRIQHGYRMRCPNFCPDKIYEQVMMKCWSSDPDMRPSFSQLSRLMARSLSASLIQRLRSQEEPYLRARSSKSQRLDSTGTEPQRYANVSVTDRLASQSSEATTSSGLGRSIYYNSSTPNSQTSSLLIAEKDYENLSLSGYNADIDIPAGYAPTPFSHQDIEELLKIASDDTSSSKSGETSQTGPPSYRSVMKKGSRSDSCGSHVTNQSQANSDFTNQSQPVSEGVSQSRAATVEMTGQPQAASGMIGQSQDGTELKVIVDKSQAAAPDTDRADLSPTDRYDDERLVFLNSFDNQIYSESLC